MLVHFVCLTLVNIFRVPGPWDGMQITQKKGIGTWFRFLAGWTCLTSCEGKAPLWALSSVLAVSTSATRRKA